ncbi:ATP-binding cassette domain-containing protein [Clostridium sulfidigenes]|uniref:ATP-binding cassette domain-containing protein n=1 Tax=Clostridium sulfidigenes TaxID=318464 RepID=UPI003F89F6AF
MSSFILKDLCYSYNKEREIISNMNYEFKDNTVYSIIGKSGAGKTTLLSLLSGLAKPTEGSILFDGKDISEMDSFKYRSNLVGVIFQSFNLLLHLTAIENVILSIDISSKKIINKKEKALEILNSVGLDEATATRRVLELSGGEQQRVAIARVLSYDPAVILADEPTGNLDGETESSIVKIFQKLAHEQGKCIILVTHSPAVANMCDVVYELSSKNKNSIA